MGHGDRGHNKQYRTALFATMPFDGGSEEDSPWSVQLNRDCEVLQVFDDCYWWVVLMLETTGIMLPNREIHLVTFSI